VGLDALSRMHDGAALQEPGPVAMCVAPPGRTEGAGDVLGDGVPRMRLGGKRVEHLARLGRGGGGANKVLFAWRTEKL
jgi:hypothetical protein